MQSRIKVLFYLNFITSHFFIADSTFSFVVKVLLTKDFLLDNARSKIATLDLLGLPDNLTHPLDKLEYFASLLDFENTYMVNYTCGCFGFV